MVSVCGFRHNLSLPNLDYKSLWSRQILEDFHVIYIMRYFVSHKDFFFLISLTDLGTDFAQFTFCHSRGISWNTWQKCHCWPKPLFSIITFICFQNRYSSHFFCLRSHKVFSSMGQNNKIPSSFNMNVTLVSPWWPLLQLPCLCAHACYNKI